MDIPLTVGIIGVLTSTNQKKIHCQSFRFTSNSSCCTCNDINRVQAPPPYQMNVVLVASSYVKKIINIILIKNESRDLGTTSMASDAHENNTLQSKKR